LARQSADDPVRAARVIGRGIGMTGAGVETGNSAIHRSRCRETSVFAAGLKSHDFSYGWVFLTAGSQGGSTTILLAFPREGGIPAAVRQQTCFSA